MNVSKNENISVIINSFSNNDSCCNCLSICCDVLGMYFVYSMLVCDELIVCEEGYMIVFV